MIAATSIHASTTAAAPPESPPLDDAAMERELAELSAYLDAAGHRQVTLIRMIDESGRWARQGAKTCAHWLSWRINMDLGAARERLRIGHALVDLPAVDEAFRSARLSYSQVRAITRVATPDNEARLLELAECSTASQLERICRGVRQAVRADADHVGTDGSLERWVRLRPMGDGTTRVEAQLVADEAARVMDAIRKVKASMRGGEAVPTMADALVRLIEEWAGGQTTASEAASARCDDDGAPHGDAPHGDAPPDHGRAEDAGTDDGRIDDARCDGARAEVTRSDEPRSDEVRSDEPRSDEARGDEARSGEARSDEARSDEARSALYDRALHEREGAGRGGAQTNGPADTARRGSPRPRTGGDLGTLVLHLAPDVLERGHAVTLDDGTLLDTETFRRIACDCGLVPVQTDEEGEPLDVGRKTRAIPPALRRAITIRDGGCCTFPGCTHTIYLHGHHLEHWFDGGATRKDNLILLCSFHHQLVHEGGWTVCFDNSKRPRFVRPEGAPHPHTFPRKGIDLSDALGAIEERHRELAIDEETARSGWGGERPDIAMCVEAAMPREALDGPATAWLAEQGYGGTN